MLDPATLALAARHHSRFRRDSSPPVALDGDAGARVQNLEKVPVVCAPNPYASVVLAYTRVDLIRMQCYFRSILRAQAVNYDCMRRVVAAVSVDCE